VFGCTNENQEEESLEDKFDYRVSASIIFNNASYTKLNLEPVIFADDEQTERLFQTFNEVCHSDDFHQRVLDSLVTNNDYVSIIENQVISTHQLEMQLNSETGVTDIYFWTNEPDLGRDYVSELLDLYKHVEQERKLLLYTPQIDFIENKIDSLKLELREISDQTLTSGKNGLIQIDSLSQISSALRQQLSFLFEQEAELKIAAQSIVSDFFIIEKPLAPIKKHGR